MQCRKQEDKWFSGLQIYSSQQVMQRAQIFVKMYRHYLQPCILPIQEGGMFEGLYTFIISYIFKDM